MLSRSFVVASSLALIAVGAAAPNASAARNAVVNQVPTGAKVDTPIPFSASIAWNIKDERSSRFLVWNMWIKRGTTKCPVDKRPKKSAGWQEQVEIRRPSEDTTSSSISTLIGPFSAAGRYRICSYIATAHYKKNSSSYAYDDIKAQDSDLMKVSE